MYHRVYSMGYSGRSPQEIKNAAEVLGAKVVDVRLRPFSRNPLYTRKALAQLLGSEYVHCVHFGNVNHRKGGPIELAAPEKGLKMLEEILLEQPIILVCVCRMVIKCHRLLVADHLKKALGCEVHHIPYAEKPSVGTQANMF